MKHRAGQGSSVLLSQELMSKSEESRASISFSTVKVFSLQRPDVLAQY